MLGACLTARADFSYSSTTKTSGGPMGTVQPHTTKHYLKGQKMKIDSGDTVIIMDFDAQTMTSINNARKTYSVTKFADVGQGMRDAGVETKIDVHETGQHKTINGFNCSEAVMTMEMESPQTRQQGMKMQMEMDLWLSPDVPGASELRTFYERNAAKMPWSAMSGGGRNAQTMAEVQRKMASMHGVPVLEVMKMKPQGGAMQSAQNDQAMAQARARLEEMKKQGGQQAAAAERALAMMGGGGGGGMAVFETTVESSDFSAASIPDSVFGVPAGYQKTER